jgi:CBS domain-containing protein
MTRRSPAASICAMKVKEVMRATQGIASDATLADAAEAIQDSGCEAVPVVDSSNGEVAVRQLVALRDLPKLRRVEASASRGHAVGEGVLELLGALGRRPGRFPTIEPEATLTDAWGIMSDECLTHLPVVENGQVIGMVSLVVTFAEFPHRSPTAGFWH